MTKSLDVDKREYQNLEENDEPCTCCFCCSWKCCGISCAIFIVIILVLLIIFLVMFGEEIYMGYKGYQEAKTIYLNLSSDNPDFSVLGK